MTAVHLSRFLAISSVAALAIAAGPSTAAAPGAAAGSKAAAAQGTVMRWRIDGVERVALVFTPRAARGAARHPLVLAFHGHGGTMRSTAARMDIHARWPQAIVVYPQGLNTPTPLDPAGSQPGWQSSGGEVGDRDLAFVDAIVATMRRAHGADARRTYATGFSNGAAFTLLLWAERPRTIAAVAEVAGRLDPSTTPTAPRPFLAVAGRNDAIVPFGVQRQTILRARLVNRAYGPTRPCGRYCASHGSRIGAPVTAYVHPGGHEYPAWASREIVRFLKSHPQP